MTVVWRAVETASQVVAGVGLWGQRSGNGNPSDGWSFRTKFEFRKFPTTWSSP